MRRVFKRIAGYLLIPLTRWYLRKERVYRYEQTTVVIEPGVFHPGLFPSSRMLLTCLKKLDVREKKVLELGAGTGLLSIVAAQSGAKVTASDLSALALRNIQRNALANRVSLLVVDSDLFEHLSDTYDLILVNPPYYQGVPTSEAALAWYAGASLEYFERFFRDLHRVVHADTIVWMTLTQEAPLPAIRTIAAKTGYTLDTVHEKSNLLDGRDFVFRINCSTTGEDAGSKHTSGR